MQIRKKTKPVDANTAFLNYKKDIEYTETVYTASDLEAARKEERERCANVAFGYAKKYAASKNEFLVERYIFGEMIGRAIRKMEGT